MSLLWIPAIALVAWIVSPHLASDNPATAIPVVNISVNFPAPYSVQF